MEKYQYQCIKAATEEVASLESDGYSLHEPYVTIPVGGTWMRHLVHPNGNQILVEMSPNRDRMEVWVNGKRKKCQKFGA